jgi:hypothetical protein
MKPVWRGLSHFALGGQPDAEVVAAMKPAWRGLSHFAFGGQPDLCPGTGVPVAREKEYPNRAMHLTLVNLCSVRCPEQVPNGLPA